MILTTTNSIEGFKIIDYKGIVAGSSFEYKTKFSFKVEKSKAITNDVLDEANEIAFQKLKENAKNLNANAVVGISIDLETVNGTSFFVNAIGTAVHVVPEK
ncbi:MULTISPECIES: YbjQ family protein [unclassified Lacinutrix]|uniref:YbjQ family protein n=1 Tax=unclassified Lacinutrix TaxID=2647285 RepID=UPI00020A37D9|nr:MULTISPECIES: heavy metal-binding domain-containing protein [unclassified Lacinutrix]AEH00847.1 protein of unknown function DUF74 [Lacinutrix sp. 5H-3-7-4]OIQ23466.1 MAG: hypothetical protein BM549_02565 [Lacinutrix sp. MedPE-SW]